MTKLFYSFALLLIASVILTGCRTDDPIPPDPDNPIAVNLRANIAPKTVRVANNEWQANDQIGFFMVEAGQPLSNASIVNNNLNVLMTIESGALTPNHPVLYPVRGNVGFIAYFPFQSSVGSNFTIPVNVGNQSAGLPTEVLFSNNITNQAPTESAVMLTFRYSLAKIEITVRGGANSTLTEADFAAMTASIEGVYTQADLQLANGTFANHRARQTVRLHRTGNTTTSTTFEALILPTTNEITIVFDLGGGAESSSILRDGFAAATLYDLNFTLNFPVATLTEAVIIPREPSPPQNIDVDATPPINASIIRATNIQGDDASGVITVKASFWYDWDRETQESRFFTVAQAPFQNNGFTLQLASVPNHFLYLISYDDGDNEFWNSFTISDENARWRILFLDEGINAYNSSGMRIGNLMFVEERNNVFYAATWIYSDRAVTIQGTYRWYDGWYDAIPSPDISVEPFSQSSSSIQRTTRGRLRGANHRVASTRSSSWTWEQTLDLNLRQGWNIVYFREIETATGGESFVTSRKPVGINLRWHLYSWANQVDEGVVINGIRWATRNVDAPGTFTQNPEDAGMFFQWGRGFVGWSSTNPLINSDGGTVWNTTPASGWMWEDWDWYNQEWNNPCPGGWRVPSTGELEFLINAGSVWTTQNGVNGRLFGTAPNQIFLPAAGSRFSNGVLNPNVGITGEYWSARNGQALGINNNIATRISAASAGGLSVRCVEDVIIPAQSVTLNRTTLNLFVGATETLIVTTTPANATYRNDITWEYWGQWGVVTVEQTGEVIALAPGTATVAARTVCGASTYIEVTVVPRVYYPTQGGVVVNGLEWAMYNVAAPGAFTESPEDAGMFFQWGRRTGWSSTDPMVNSDGGTGWDNSNPTFATWERANDPCPAGWRIPTMGELSSLNRAHNWWSTWDDVSGRFFSGDSDILFLPAAGFRSSFNGTLTDVGSVGHYWSSTGSGVTARDLRLSSSHSQVFGSPARAFGFNVRCVADI